MAKAAYEGPPEALERYEELLATRPDIERKGAKNPYTSRNGHMCSFLDVAGTLSIRLPAELRAEFLATYASRLSEQHGHTMKEFVVVPEAVMSDIDALGRWFDASHDWVGALKPKATIRKKK